MKTRELALFVVGFISIMGRAIAQQFGAVTSAPMVLDIEGGIRQSDICEKLTYDSVWYGNESSTVKLRVNDADFAEVQGVGEKIWEPRRPGIYTLTATTLKNGVIVGDVLSAEFKVVGRDLANAAISFPDGDALYDGTPRTPRVEVVYQGETLVEGVDYTLRYEENISGVGRVIVTGMGRFHDEIEKTFKIQPADKCTLDICSGIRKANFPEKITYDENWFSSTGAGYIRIMENGTRIAQENGAGEYSWTATEGGLYTLAHRIYIDGYLQNDKIYTATFGIPGGPLENWDLTVTLEKNVYQYDGLPKTPKVTVKSVLGDLMEGTDFSVAYQNNVEVGTARVIVTGIGIYSGSFTRTFRIVESVSGAFQQVRQRYPWNGYVDIGVSIKGDSNKEYPTTFTAYDIVGGTNIPMNVVAVVGGTITNKTQSLAPGNYKLIWNADNDLPYEYVNTGVVIRASIEDYGVIPEGGAPSTVFQSELASLDIQFYPVTFTENKVDLTSRNIAYGFESGKNWTKDTSNKKTGTFSYKSYAISHNGSTYLTATVKGKGTFSFWWKVSSESNYDWLRYYVNGTEKAKISGTKDWAQVTIPIMSTGETVIKWTYSKDGSQSTGSDCGWIDAAWTPTEVFRYDTITNMSPSWTSYVSKDQWMPTRKLKGVAGITFSSAWNGDIGAEATSVVFVDGMKWIEKTGEGVEMWRPDAKGTYVLDHNVQNNGASIGPVLRAKFIVEEIEMVPPVLSGVSVAQRYPWNGLVDVKCVLEGGANQNYNVAFVVNDEAGGTNIPARTFWQIGGNTTNNVLTVRPGNLHFVWDANADIAEDGEFPAVSITVKAEPASELVENKHDKVQLWEGGPYWATTNIGAEKPEDSGYYFWWGDTVGYKRENDKWVASDGSNLDFSFANSNIPTYGKDVSTLNSEGWTTSENILAPEHDAANIHWGNGWRMPTEDELRALESYCDWTWTTQNGVKGYVIKGRGAYASNSIFLPAAGDGRDTSLNNVGSSGYYWSSVPYSDDYNAWLLYFYSSYRSTDDFRRHYGRPVRPVLEFTK